jgi:lysine-ketoglutarate reductase/saccharopine dehydrogenase-like protein (TIGR00300 family)
MIECFFVSGAFVAYRHPDFQALGLSNAPECRFEAAPKDTTLPDGFMSTTNFPTYVKVAGQWRMPEMPRMDSHLVWDPKSQRLVIKEFRLVKKGDLIAVATKEDGSEGVLVWNKGFEDPNAAEGHDEAFSFMSSDVSREKPVNYGAIFDQFMENRGDKGRILWVIGPALVHARGREAMEWLIHSGFAHCVFAGNAVGVHDVEAALFGSTLGMKKDGTPEVGGHAYHMRAINEVKKAGSIKALVEQGKVKDGIMHACVVTDTPFVLAGSIRDDGPLPETITDALESQGQMREYTNQATMVVMVATALHSIAAGNMLPTFCTKPNGEVSEITTICVDQTEFLVSKLKDRGTHQAFGVVTNAQDFMRLLQLELMTRI